MSRSYEVSPKHLLRINRPPHSVSVSDMVEINKPNASNLPLLKKLIHAPWNPVNAKYYEDSSSEDDDDEFDDNQGDRGGFVMPLTPSPSNLSGIPAQNLFIPQSDSSISNIDEQEDPDMYMSDD